MKRITVLTGHFGSGKTEISINLAVAARENLGKVGFGEGILDRVALVDLDIANPYFRSRERQKMLEDLGVWVEHNAYGHDITEDLPALSASIRGPLQMKSCRTIVDVGGDNSGARVLNQFTKDLTGSDVEVFFVLNGNRPETGSVQGCIDHLKSIEYETGLKISALVNNTHMLRETQVRDIMKGHELCEGVSVRTGIPIAFSTCCAELEEDLRMSLDREQIETEVFILKLFMRPTWLDRS